MRVPTSFENPLCAEVDTELFFPEKGEQNKSAIAKSLCLQCPHIDECLEWALRYERYGIWGGTNELTRKRIRSKRKIKFLGE